jgi:alginate export protein
MGKQAQESWAAVGEVGYRFVNAPWKPWLRTGYTTTSGSGSSTGDLHGTFFQILPTARLYALFPFYNMMNRDDLSSELILTPLENIETRTTLHNLWLSSRRDLWYQGGGAYDNSSFGYVGRPRFGRSYLATLLDTGVTWTVNRHISTYIYYGHSFGGSVVSAIYPVSKQADYGYVEATFSF